MKGSEDLDRRDWILLALLASAEHKLTAVKLQKTLFLLGARRRTEVGNDFYEFRPYHYGPFDANVYHDADLLRDEGLIEVDRSQGRSLRRYKLTEAGEVAAERAVQRRPGNAQAYLTNVVTWAEPLPFNALVRAIYDEFPEMRANSIFEER